MRYSVGLRWGCCRCHCCRQGERRVLRQFEQRHRVQRQHPLVATALHLVQQFDEVDSELVLLELDREALDAAGLSVVFEPFSPDDPGAENFPHVYGGALPVTCVTRETRFANSADLIDGLMAFQAAGSPPGIRSEEGQPRA